MDSNNLLNTAAPAMPTLPMAPPMNQGFGMNQTNPSQSSSEKTTPGSMLAQTNLQPVAQVPAIIQSGADQTPLPPAPIDPILPQQNIPQDTSTASDGTVNEAASIMTSVAPQTIPTIASTPAIAADSSQPQLTTPPTQTVSAAVGEGASLPSSLAQPSAMTPAAEPMMQTSAPKAPSVFPKIIIILVGVVLLLGAGYFILTGPVKNALQGDRSSTPAGAPSFEAGTDPNPSCDKPCTGNLDCEGRAGGRSILLKCIKESGSNVGKCRNPVCSDVVSCSCSGQ